MNPTEVWKEHLSFIDAHLATEAQGWEGFVTPELAKSMKYSLFTGGKRFRPLLTLLTAESLGLPPQSVAPWACAIEMIHTYSLIHDDLPCMDNDDFRRGLPTNHKVHGEATALLAGDALLTEAFGVLARGYTAKAEILPALINLLSRAAGAPGMVGGQVEDLIANDNVPTREAQLEIHRKKTGALICASLHGVGIICSLPQERMKALENFGWTLGMAFQVADDIEDANEKSEKGGLIRLIGYDETRSLLSKLNSDAMDQLRLLRLDGSPLKAMVEWNTNRVGTS